MLDLMPLLDADKIQDLERFGEDSWGLLRLIEESFDVQFTADELIEANTVGRLRDCISKRIEGQPSERCLTAVAFYRLRQASIGLLSIPRTYIRPISRLEELFPWSQRLSKWKTLSKQSGLVLPRLAYPGWLTGTVLVISVATIWFLLKQFGEIPAALTLFAGIFSFISLLWLTRPIARAFPRSCKSCADLAKVTVARNHAALVSEAGRCSSRELFSVLRQLIAVEIGCDLEEIREETRFPEGLKID